jgi:hypothetical protein
MKKNCNGAALLSLLAFAPPLVLAAAVAAVPSACRAETPQGPRSRIAGVALPGGAVRYDKANRNFTDTLISLAADKKVNLPAAGSAAEVYAWQGSDLRPDRFPFMRTALRKALTAAGYTVQEISDGDISFNIFEHFPSDADGLPFHPDTTKSRFYFQARHEGRAEALVGAWIPGDEALTLAFLPVAFKPAPKAIPLPDAKTGDGVVLVKDINDTMKGIAPPRLPVFPPVARKPNTVRGLVKDGAGRPIAGAQVVVFSSAGGGFRTSHKAVSSAQGAYQVVLPVGVGEVAEANCKVQYNGVTYDLPLRQVGAQGVTFNGRDGYIANFVLQTWGEYGATLRVLDNCEKGTIELTLTPKGRLLDGTVGRTFVYRYDASVSSERYLNGLPLGRYSLTARLLDDGEALPLRAGNTFGTESERELKDSLPVDFKPGYTFSQYNPGKSNSKIQRFEVTLEP